MHAFTVHVVVKAQVLALENPLAQIDRHLEMWTQLVGPFRIGCPAPGFRFHHMLMFHYVEGQVGCARARRTVIAPCIRHAGNGG